MGYTSIRIFEVFIIMLSITGYLCEMQILQSNTYIFKADHNLTCFVDIGLNEFGLALGIGDFPKDT